MTDKQIKIDKIDISKCEFCEDSEYCHIYSGTANFKWLCEENEDCQIKNLLLQLKAKEQECEELKKYKKVVNKLAGMQVMLTNEEKMPMLYENAKDLKLKQLSKTLIEIKEIAEPFCGTCQKFEPEKKDKNNIYCRFCNYGKILQKISEVENEA